MVGKLVIFLILGQVLVIRGNPPFVKNRNEILPFIVGGRNANIADYPYQVQILVQGQHACGGSILTNTKILSAAHCFESIPNVNQITVRAGSSYRTSGGQIVNVKKVNSHHDFNSATYDYDVAVVELASALTYGSGINSISLPQSSAKIVNGQEAVATGWGLTTDGGSLANQLQVVNLPLITTKSCQNTIYSSAITSRMFCAGESGKDTCSGDSGGPLVSNGVQVGIVSWGDICGQAKTPGVYTKVTKFLDFINNHIK